MLLSISYLIFSFLFQPALLYIVPCVIGFLAVHTIFNGEVKQVCLIPSCSLIAIISVAFIFLNYLTKFMLYVVLIYYMTHGNYEQWSWFWFTNLIPTKILEKKVTMSSYDLLSQASASVRKERKNPLTSVQLYPVSSTEICPSPPFPSLPFFLFIFFSF